MQIQLQQLSFEAAMAALDVDPRTEFVAEEVSSQDEGRMTDPVAIQQFVLAGRAKFTLVSKATGARFTFRVSVPKDLEPGVDPIHFVSLLTGADNESAYSYFGYVKRGVFYHGRAKAKVAETAPSCKAFVWFFRMLITQQIKPLLDAGKVEFWHEGACGRCGRTLTVPSSIASGFGPECIGRIGS
jgi:hypothetical protein